MFAQHNARSAQLYIALWYGVSLAGLIASVLRSEGSSELLLKASVGLIIALGAASALDRAQLWWRGTRGLSYPLTSEGLSALMIEVRPAVILCAEPELTPELVEYDELAEGGARPLSSAQLSEALEALSSLPSHAPLALEPALKLADYLEASTLPNLPQLEGRAQLGLFATLSIPARRLFLWESDLGVARASARATLPDPVRMNRRTLCAHQGLELFQGGGPEQRSNASILANFYWCHSESTPRGQGRFLIYPPHYFGPPNCEYVTTLNAQGAPCSGLKTLRQIAPGEQLLMYTGSAQSAMTIQLRVTVGWLMGLLAPACSLLPWLWMWGEVWR